MSSQFSLKICEMATSLETIETFAISSPVDFRRIWSWSRRWRNGRRRGFRKWLIHERFFAAYIGFKDGFGAEAGVFECLNWWVKDENINFYGPRHCTYCFWTKYVLMYFFNLLPTLCTYFHVYLIDGAARIFPTSHAATENQTNVSSATPLFEGFKQGCFTDWATAAMALLMCL